MTNNRVIVDFIAEITPSPTAPFSQAFEASPDGFLCTFRQGGTARLRPGLAGTTLLGIMEGRRQRKVPVYVEVSTDDTIVQLLIPGIQKTSEVRESKSGGIEVVLFDSQVVHTLNRAGADYQVLLDALLEGRTNDRWLIVTATDSHEIIHVVPLSPDDILGLPLPKPPNLFDRLRWWFGSVQFQVVRWWRLHLGVWLAATTYRRLPSLQNASAMFNLVAARSCDSTGMPSDCIPFLYPDAGCRARAHEMCRLITGAGLEPFKVWIYPGSAADLRVRTSNSPACAVAWGFHVAPGLDVLTPDSTWVTYVIDPSFFGGPVILADWVASMNDPLATTVVRDWPFYAPAIRDDFYVVTNHDLEDKRQLFRARCLANGPPPYVC